MPGKANPTAKIKRTEVRAALMKQLEAMGADKAHYIDLVDDYMRLWDIKVKLLADIRKRGVSYQEASSTGVKMWKYNQSVKDLVAVERQMLSILSDLKITTEHAGAGDDEKDGL